VLWFCCDGGIFNKHNDDNEIDIKRLTEVYDELNIQQLDDDDPRIKQVSKILMKCWLQN